MTGPAAAVAVREFEPDDADGVLAAIMESEAYALAATGYLPAPGDLQSLFYALPDGASPEDKRLSTILAGREPVGVIDALLGYPTPDAVSCALFLLRPSRTRRGIGAAAVECALDVARDRGFRVVRASCPSGWAPGEAFLEAQGFDRVAPLDARMNRVVHPHETDRLAGAWERTLG